MLVPPSPTLMPAATLVGSAGGAPGKLIVWRLTALVVLAAVGALVLFALQWRGRSRPSPTR